MVVIGDVHGTYKTLKKLLKEFPSDPICLVGDLVDRGPSSVDVIQFVMDNYDRIKCVKGNHEVMMLDFYRHEMGTEHYGDVWLMNGGKKVYNAYKYKHGTSKLETHLDFLSKLPYYLEFPEVKNDEGQHLLVSHSIATSLDLDRCVETGALIWGRHFPEKDPSNGKWFNVFGHTPVPQPVLTDWFANIDTGCCFGGMYPDLGHLTALKFPELELVMVKKDEADHEPEPPPPARGLYG